MLAQSVLDIHQTSLVVDAHQDLIFDVVQKTKKGHKDALDQHVIQLDSGGVTACITTVWADGSYWRRNAEQHAKEPTLAALQQLSEIRKVLRSNDRFTEVSSAKEILEAKRNGKIAVMYHLEGGLPLGGVLERLEVFYGLGLRSLGLTWNRRNLIGDGVAERSAAGLSNFGAQVVEEANRLGILLDISHLSSKGVTDVLELSRLPVIASHSNSRAIFDHSRNLTDEEIQAVCEKGGVIGVCPFPSFVSKEQPSLSKLLDHVDHIANLVGTNHIGFGGDFLEIDTETAKQNAKEWLLPAEAQMNLKELEDPSKLPNFTNALLSRGYSETDIQKILGENVLRILSSVLRR